MIESTRPSRPDRAPGCKRASIATACAGSEVLECAGDLRGMTRGLRFQALLVTELRLNAPQLSDLLAVV